MTSGADSHRLELSAIARRLAAWLIGQDSPDPGDPKASEPQKTPEQVVISPCLYDSLDLEAEQRRRQEEGRPALSFVNAKLEKATFVDAKLAGADFDECEADDANFSFANLQGASFYRARLRNAVFVGAVLTGVDFCGAVLDSADFRQAKGLTSDQFAGASVQGARLPESLQKFDALESVEKASATAGKLFSSTLAASIYCAVIVFTTQNGQLLGNNSTVTLPLLRSEIPLVGFYAIAPILLFVAYTSLHLYLRYIWRSMSRLPLIFPSGESLERKSYSWVITIFACRLLLTRSPLPDEILRAGHRSSSEILLGVLLAWVVVPASVFLIWIRFLGRLVIHHNWSDYLVALTGLLMTAGCLSVGFRLLVKASLDLNYGRKPPPAEPKRLSARIGGWCAPFVVAALYGGALLPLVATKWSSEIFQLRDLANSDIRRSFLPKVNLRGADLEGAQISDADLREASFDDAYMSAANCERSDLRRVSAIRTKFVRAVLNNARLTSSDLRLADLSDVDARSTQFDGAVLIDANLSDAHLGQSRFRNADLEGAILARCDLTQADLREASIMNASMAQAILKSVSATDAEIIGCDLRQADLTGGVFDDANLEESRFDQCSLTNARFEGAILTGSKFKDAHGEKSNFRFTECTNTRFDNASFTDGDFRSARLDQTSFRGAHLVRCDFRGVRWVAGEDLIQDFRGAKIDTCDADPGSEVERALKAAGAAANPVNPSKPVHALQTHKLTRKPKKEG